MPLGEVIPPKIDTGFIVGKSIGISLGVIIILLSTYLILLDVKIVTNCKYENKVEYNVIEIQAMNLVIFKILNYFFQHVLLYCTCYGRLDLPL